MRDSLVAIAAELASDVVQWATRAMDEGRYKPLEVLATLVDTPAVHEAIEKARNVHADRPTDPGPPRKD